MNRIKQAIHLLLAVPLICVVLSGYAFAANEDALWTQLNETPDTVSAVVEANTAVTDGTIQLTFDTDKLTYVGCDFVGESNQYKPYVAMYAVNDTQAQEGVVRISWVAPEARTNRNSVDQLFQVNFKPNQSSAAPGDLSVSGTANSPDGQAVPVGQQPTPQPEESPAPSTSASPTQQPTSAPTASMAPGNNSHEGQPATGDHAHMGLYLTLLGVCSAALGLAVVWRFSRRGAK